MTLLFIAFALCSLGFVILWRMPACGAAGEGGTVAGTSVSIVIPARNEAQNLPPLLKSISAQNCQPGEVIVVDDDSSDGTGEIARQHGARVVASRPLPEGWGGKTWACQQGADAAGGTLLLFLDADTQLEPGGLERMLMTRRAAGDVLSVMPWHTVWRFHEQFSAFFNLLMAAGLGAFTIAGRRLRPAGLFGQMLLVPRDLYVAAGGHAAVRSRNLENSWLSRNLLAAGATLHCRSGRGVLSFRMYPDNMSGLVRGWAKGFAAGAGVTPPLLMALIIAWLSGLIMVPANFTASVIAGDPAHSAWWGMLFLFCVLQVHFQFRRVGSFHWAAALCYPVLLVFYFAVFTLSAFRGRIGVAATWKGRPFHAR